MGLWALALCLYFLFLMRTAFGTAAAGAQALLACTTLALALCLFSGTNQTCDSLSSEKREGTLGLLLLTHLKSRDIVLGKLCGHGLPPVYLLIAITPVLAIPIFVGGVSGVELLRVPLLLLNSLLLSLSIGLLISCLTVAQRTARSVAGLVMVTLAFFAPGTAYALDRYGLLPQLAFALNLLSPTYALRMSAGSAFGLSTNSFWTALVVQFAIGVCALAATAWLLPSFWKIRPPRISRLKHWITTVAHGDSLTRKRRRFRMLSRNGMFWLNNRDRLGVFGPIVFTIGTFLVVGTLVWYFKITGEELFAVLFVTLALNDFAMRIRVAQIASVQLGADRQNGALEMLLSTPMTVREIVGGIWSAIRHRLLWTYVPLLTAYAVIAAMFIGPVPDPKWIIVLFFGMYSGADFIATGYVAIWSAMRMRHPQGATGYALLRVQILPFTICALVLPILAQSSINLDGGTVFVITAVIWSISTGTAIRTARRNIFNHFREAATDRYNFEERTGPMAMARRFRDNFLTSFLLRRRRPGVLS